MKKHYISKSFFSMGKELSNCLNCEYCRLLDKSTKDFNITTTPTEINSAFSEFPVAINLFHGDPMLQISNTLNLLERLEKANHKGPVIIITKAAVRSLEKIKNFDLDIHICLSTFGINHALDGGNLKIFEDNLEKVSKAGIKTSIEFRPIIYQINDSEETIENVFRYAAKYQVPIGYCGMQGKPEILQNLSKKGYNIKPYPGTKFNSHKKFLGEDVEKTILRFSKKYKIPVFRKTSCLISYQHNLERDYNAHYYRPGEVGCYTCIMKDKCFKFHKSLDKSVYKKTKKILPYPHKIVYRDNHTCILANQKICLSVTEHCFNIKGYLITTDKTLTTADVRATKWLTGLTMDVKMVESWNLSNIWQQ